MEFVFKFINMKQNGLLTTFMNTTDHVRRANANVQVDGCYK